MNGTRTNLGIHIEAQGQQNRVLIDINTLQREILVKKVPNLRQFASPNFRRQYDAFIKETSPEFFSLKTWTCEKDTANEIIACRPEVVAAVAEEFDCARLAAEHLSVLAAY